MGRRRAKHAEPSMHAERDNNRTDAAHILSEQDGNGNASISQHLPVPYTIADTPRSSASVADGEIGPLVVSTGRSSASAESAIDAVPEPSKKNHTPGRIVDQPSFVLSVRRTAATLSPVSARREPHYMQPLVRDPRSPTGGLPSHRDDEVPDMHAAADVAHPLAAYHALHRYVPYVPPTPHDIIHREEAKRERISIFEIEEFQDIRETCTHDIANIKATVVRREKYLASFEYAKCQAVGHDRRARIQQWEAEKQRAASEALTFAPHISQHASQLRSSNAMEGFLAANKLWVEQNKKKRRAASAVVFRQEDATFAPQLSSNSYKIVERLRKESKHTNIVDGWAQRLGEHKQKMEALQLKYAHPFQPQSHQRAHSRGGAVSVSPRRVSAHAVVTRLYDASLEHMKSVEATLEGQRLSSLSPKPVRRSTSSIQEHIKVMQSRDEKLQKKLATKRAHSMQEETQLEHNSHIPIVNPNSVTLAELHRMRRSASLSTTAASPSAAGTSSAIEGGPPMEPTNSSVHHLLYRTSTAASESKQRAHSNSQQDHHGGSVLRQASERSGHNARSTREFLMRNEKLLQTRDVHIREIREQMQEQQVRDCTFAPSISATTLRLAEHRRASQSYRDPSMGDVVELSPQVLRSYRNDVHNAMPQRASGTVVGGVASKSPSHRIPGDVPGMAAAQPAVRFQRTDHEGPPPQRSSASSQHGSETLQERMEDIEGLLRQWRWLEESSRL